MNMFKLPSYVMARDSPMTLLATPICMLCKHFRDVAFAQRCAMRILTGSRQLSYLGNTITASRFQVIAELFLNRETKKPISLSNAISSAWICHSLWCAF
jgi:hypothetical protein